LFNVLTWFPVLALVVVGGLMYWRRVHRELPLFFIYALSAPVIGVLRPSVFYTAPHNVYFYVYWISELAAAVFVSLALYEVFLRRLFPSFQKVRFYRNLFPIAACVILLVTVIVAAKSADPKATFMSASRGADFIRTAVLVFFVALMVFMGREWRRYDFGIAFGFGIQAAATLADIALRSGLHSQPAVLDMVQFIAYNISCMIWLITFLKPESPQLQAAPGAFSSETLDEARKWEGKLKELLVRDKRKTSEEVEEKKQ
jgi:hypothetical protein